MEPLRKALRLPRVNLFIADDTGLGKTIEAGLIARELLLRKKAKTIVVAAPPSVLEQWKAELDERFGLVFEVLDRHYVASVRRERGFGVNPWETHSRFLISHNLLVDPTYADPMRAWLGPMKAGQPADPRRGAPRGAIERRSLRHRDQVHPRDPRPRRALRAPAVPLGDPAQRPLEQLLDAAGAPRPVPLHPRREGPRQEGAGGGDGPPAEGGHPRDPGRLPESEDRVAIAVDNLPADAPELALSSLLDEYRTLREQRFSVTSKRTQASAGLLVVGLQQRLFSSIEAFARSLETHRKTVERQWADAEAQAEAELTEAQAEQLLLPLRPAPTMRTRTAPTRTSRRDQRAVETVTQAVEAAARAAPSPRRNARPNRRSSTRWSRSPTQHRNQPDGKDLALIDWIREHMCPDLPAFGKRATGSPKWNDRRVLIFTESREGTKRHLVEILESGDRGDRARRRADRGHHRADER